MALTSIAKLVDHYDEQLAATGRHPDTIELTPYELKCINENFRKSQRDDYDKFKANSVAPELVPEFQEPEEITFGSMFMGVELVRKGGAE